MINFLLVNVWNNLKSSILCESNTVKWYKQRILFIKNAWYLAPGHLLSILQSVENVQWPIGQDTHVYHTVWNCLCLQHQTVQMISTTFHMNHFHHIIHLYNIRSRVRDTHTERIVHPTFETKVISLSSLTIQCSAISRPTVIVYIPMNAKFGQYIFISDYLCTRTECTCACRWISSINCVVWQMHAVPIEMKIFATPNIMLIILWPIARHWHDETNVIYALQRIVCCGHHGR